MPESKKVVIKVDVHDGDDKRKAFKAISSLSGIESLAMDMKDKKLTIIGDVDPVDVVGKLKKWNPNILTVGPAKEEKKPPPENKPPSDKPLEVDPEVIRRLLEAYNPYNYMTPRYCVHSEEDDPIGCVIC